MMKIAIIGGGAAGLCAGRRAALYNCIPYIFESSSEIGGTWVYDERVGRNPKTEEPIHSSMYASLKTNLPVEVMAFPDFPFPPNSDSFVGHSQVLEYLRSYGKDVMEHVQLNTKVNTVHRQGSKWLLHITDLARDDNYSSEFDALMVCNGHYTFPAYGFIENAESFTETSLHSHDYRHPDPYRDKTVLVFGGASSGIDIGIEISSVARKVFLSHNKPKMTSKLPDNLEQVAGVTAYRDGGFKLLDGSVISGIDALIYCTGYKFRFPFLNLEECGVEVDDEKRRVYPLYQHCINIKYPSMCFVGLPFKICPFPLFDTQVQFFLKTLTKDIVLPTQEEMLQDTELELNNRIKAGMSEKRFHEFGAYQWEYQRQLADIGNFPRLHDSIKDLYNRVTDYRHQNLMEYRRLNFRLFNGEYVVGDSCGIGV